MKASQAVYCIVDTETTGLDPAADRIVEVAALRVDTRSASMLGDHYTTLVNPRIPIPATASAIHHLTDEDVADAPQLEDAMDDFDEFVGDSLLVAHNAAFDSAFLGYLSDRPWLCTKRLAQHLYPDAPAFNNQVLRYHLGLGKVRELQGLVPHRALADVVVTGNVLICLLARYLTQGHEDDVDALIALAESPIEFKSLPFGQHRGKPLAKVPYSYLDSMPRWMPDMDADLRFTRERELARRRGEAA